MTATGDSAGGFERYTPEVYGWAYRLLGRHHDALDVVQDVFLRWHTQCHRQTPQCPRGWLRRVTLNRAIDFRRRRKLDPDLIADPARIATPCEEPGSQADGEVLRDDIAAALDQLSENQRSVLVAKVYDDMTFSEIAEELQVALSTVKTHYLRAVQTVRNRLQRRWAREI